MVAADRTIPKMAQGILQKKDFTPTDHAHGDLGQPFISVTQNFLGATALQPLETRKDFEDVVEDPTRCTWSR
jgi:hypothetical protein